ncbi:ABC transporter substrate-binding protein [Nostocoides veronense]|uniref:Amino acid ABC transporter substrate-binding protein n=1 Tax=Nostocoides veronense TaxID=330836 RepID=A0ABN2LKI6_9MICO
MTLVPARSAALAGVLLATAALAACGEPQAGSVATSSTSSSASSSTTASSSSTTPSASDSAAVPISGDCLKGTVKTLADGKLTIGTDNPAYEPWFSDNDPSNGKGYESAVAYAIADKLGFSKADVTWAKVPFNKAVLPGKKDFDFDVNQVSITDERKKAVDFSSGYYDVVQSVVSYKGSPIDGKTTVADLKGVKLGGQVGTTSLTAITDQIGAKSSVYDTNDAAVQALKAHQIDGIVVDLPTAFYMTAAQLDDGIIVGQLPLVGGTPEQFGAVLDKGSALTPCVTAAVDALRADGTLDKLVGEWLSAQGAPELK